jgi:CheY-like chemotaxis protein
MDPKGVFIFIDDDAHEHKMFQEALRKFCNNDLKKAHHGEEGLELIKKYKEDIFLIVSDISMPRMNGLELKRVIEGTPELKIKAIPFIFHSSSDDSIVVKEAYSLGIQGFVKKSIDITESVQNLGIIIKFWSSIVHPNNVS